MLNLQSKDWVFDPFCGSGTTLLECAHLGFNAIGVDLNPLAILIAQTKLGLMRVDIQVLRDETQSLIKRLEQWDLRYDRAFGHPESRELHARIKVTAPNRDYLAGWFPGSVLTQLELILTEIDRLSTPVVQNFARVVLSDCLRQVSWQEPADLRIRRRKDPKPNYPALPAFIKALRVRCATVLRAREIITTVHGKQRAVLADSRSALPDRMLPGVGFDAAITSPPYANALPYIDTQRLSLAFLNLLAPDAIRRVERAVIGSREISQSERCESEQLIAEAERALPGEILGLCRRALRLTKGSNDGFRRRNVGALLFRYFDAMRAVFTATLPLMKGGASFTIVIGPNRSVLGGEDVTVDTPRLLAAVGEHVGWVLEELIPLDAYQRYDMHQKNSIRSEALVVMKAPAKRPLNGR